MSGKNKMPSSQAPPDMTEAVHQPSPHHQEGESSSIPLQPELQRAPSSSTPITSAQWRPASRPTKTRMNQQASATQHNSFAPLLQEVNAPLSIPTAPTPQPQELNPPSSSTTPPTPLDTEAYSPPPLVFPPTTDIHSPNSSSYHSTRHTKRSHKKPHKPQKPQPSSSAQQLINPPTTSPSPSSPAQDCSPRPPPPAPPPAPPPLAPLPTSSTRPPPKPPRPPDTRLHSKRKSEELDPTTRLHPHLMLIHPSSPFSSTHTHHPSKKKTKLQPPSSPLLDTHLHEQIHNSPTTIDKPSPSSSTADDHGCHKDNSPPPGPPTIDTFEEEFPGVDPATIHSIAMTILKERLEKTVRERITAPSNPHNVMSPEPTPSGSSPDMQDKRIDLTEPSSQCSPSHITITDNAAPQSQTRSSSGSKLKMKPPLPSFKTKVPSTKQQCEKDIREADNRVMAKRHSLRSGDSLARSPPFTSLLPKRTTTRAAPTSKQPHTPTNISPPPPQ